MDKFTSGQEIRIINEHSKIEDGYIIVDPHQDRLGLISIKQIGAPETNADGCKIPPLRINIKRIIVGDIKEETIQKDKPTPIKQTKPTPQKIDITQFTTHGELWVRAGIDFDGTTEVNTYCLLIQSKDRYVSFNTYNGTFGKKDKQPPIQQIIDGQLVDDKIPGYPIKSINKLRNKLVKGGYKQFGT